ncbi:MAG: hypothetical protein ACI9TF_000353 [Paracrocinitomix sp.]|jgi:hypothetical protein
MTFSTPLERDGETKTGPLRAPVQMLAEQSYDDHLSVHDAATAGSLGLSGAPIEGPTHFSQFDPIAVELWGQQWFETGCISSHFSTMVVEGQHVQAHATRTTATSASISAVRDDNARVLTGTISIAPHPQTALEERLARRRDPGELFIVDQLTEGMVSSAPIETMMDLETSNGALYPFSLQRKLDGITERSSWYDSNDNPWGRPIVPMEMLSVLANKVGERWPIRQPSLGLFLDLEVRLEGTPVFVDETYIVEREVVGLSASRRVESYWTRSTLTEKTSGRHAATVLLHSGVFKDSYPSYPAGKLA